jgi:hypothetical protein
MTIKNLSLALVALALAPAASPAFATNCRLKSALNITAAGAAIDSKGTTEVRADGERQSLRVSMDARVPDGTVFGVFVNGSLAGTLAIELGAGEIDLSQGGETCLRSGVKEARRSQRIEVLDGMGNKVLRGSFRAPKSCSDPEARD